MHDTPTFRQMGVAPLTDTWYTIGIPARPPYPRMPYAPGVSAIRQRTRHASAHTPPRLCPHPTTPRHVLAPLPHPWHTPLYTLTLIAPPPPLYSLLTQHARHTPRMPYAPSAPATPLPTPHHTSSCPSAPAAPMAHTSLHAHTHRTPTTPSAPATPLPTPHHTSSCPSTPAAPMAHTSLHAHTHRTPTISPHALRTRCVRHTPAHPPPTSMYSAHPPRLCPHPTTPSAPTTPLPTPHHASAHTPPHLVMS